MAEGFSSLMDLPQRHEWPVVLRYGSVVLRPLRRRDQARWNQVRARNSAWTGPWDASLPPQSRSARPNFGEMVRSFDRRARSGEALPLAICWDEPGSRRPTRATRAPLSGQVTVSNVVYGSAHFASIGYWVDEAIAGRGVAPTAVAMVVDYCFGVMGLHRLEVNIRPENAKSLRVVEKLGFRPEGLRERFLHIDGQWRDHLSFALTVEEVPGGLLHRLQC